MLGKIIRRFLTGQQQSKADVPQQRPLSRSLQANLQMVRETFGNAQDLIVRELTPGAARLDAGLVYLEGLTDKEMVNEHILNVLMLDERLTPPPARTSPADLLTFIKKSSLSVGEIHEVKTLAAVVDGLLCGDTVLFLDGFKTALLVGTRGWEKRPISEPDTEVVVRGPREGFTETLSINTALLRRKLKNPNLQLESLTLGRQTRTNVCLAYLKNIANGKIVAEVKRRLQRIDIDAILESGYIEQLIEDAPYSPFATVSNTEKPDVVAAKLLEGRVALLVDGTPFALIAPCLFIEAFQVAEDYYSRPFYSSLIRWLRFLSFFLAISLPAFYVAVETFHQEMIPTLLLPPMAAAKEATPFPAVVEALLMGVIFEILREAGVRLPRAVGSAISIVGALVIGEAAVSSGLIGAPMVIIVSLTAITSFVVPSLGDAMAMMRLFLAILAGFLGMFGILWGYTALLLHLCALRSLGVPYLSPLAPTTASDLKDALIRAPLWSLLTRPRLIGWHNPERQRAGLKPRATANKEKEVEHPR